MTTKDTLKVIDILRDFHIVNPDLVSDGYGEFPDVYKLTELQLTTLLDRLNELP